MVCKLSGFEQDSYEQCGMSRTAIERWVQCTLHKYGGHAMSKAREGMQMSKATGASPVSVDGAG